MLNNEIFQWASNVLLAKGYTLKSHSPEIVLNTPWSQVSRFATSEGNIYLKQTPDLIALEAPIIEILNNQFHANVPDIIACNTKLDCFLMKDAGITIREHLKNKFDTKLVCSAIEQFTLLQLLISKNIVPLLDIGVPDWRLDKLPSLYKDIISKNDLLEEEGLSEIEIKQLQGLLPTISNLCSKLSQYSINQTMVQPDCNDNNMLISNGVITLIDLGEISISHPFFSIFNFLKQIKKHHGLKDEDEKYNRIKTACFKNFMHYFETQNQFLEAYNIAIQLLKVYVVLADYRLMLACGKETLNSFRNWKFSFCLKELLLTLK